MLSVIVLLDGREIACARARNISDLAKVSDYSCSWRTPVSPWVGDRYGSFNLCGHDREQTVWALVAKLAERVAELERGQTREAA